MVLLKEKVRTEKFYSIQYSNTMKKYIIASVEHGNTLYNRYYEITEKEYNYYKKKVGKLDSIADECKAQGLTSVRYLCSDRLEENDHLQQRLYDRLAGESAAYDLGNDFERI